MKNAASTKRKMRCAVDLDDLSYLTLTLKKACSIRRDEYQYISLRSRTAKINESEGEKMIRGNSSGKKERFKRTITFNGF